MRAIDSIDIFYRIKWAHRPTYISVRPASTEPEGWHYVHSDDVAQLSFQVALRPGSREPMAGCRFYWEKRRSCRRDFPNKSHLLSRLKPRQYSDVCRLHLRGTVELVRNGSAARENTDLGHCWVQGVLNARWLHGPERTAQSNLRASCITPRWILKIPTVFSSVAALQCFRPSKLNFVEAPLFQLLYRQKFPDLKVLSFLKQPFKGFNVAGSSALAPVDLSLFPNETYNSFVQVHTLTIVGAQAKADAS